MRIALDSTRKIIMDIKEGAKDYTVLGKFTALPLQIAFVYFCCGVLACDFLLEDVWNRLMMRDK